MPPLDLALGLGMIGRASNVGHVLGIKPIREVAGDVARPIIRQQTWSVANMGLAAAGRRQRHFQCVGDVFGLLRLFQPVVRDRHNRFGVGQSTPSSSITNCAGVRANLPSLADGHTNGPRSSRLKNRHAPRPSNQITLIRSPRRPQKTNKYPQYGA